MIHLANLIVTVEAAEGVLDHLLGVRSLVNDVRVATFIQVGRRLINWSVVR